jgi:hypothetical protein
MDVIQHFAFRPDQTSGFSVVLAEKVLQLAEALQLPDQWQRLAFGHPSRRCSAYSTAQRLAAVLAGLASGLRGVAPGNTWLRPNTALQQRLGGRFPDQGTIHRWLEQVTDTQANALRQHLHDVVREHGRFWQELYSARLLVVDLDGQGLIARGRRFQQAHAGYMGGTLDCGYQRWVCYVGSTGEVLDELLTPGNRTAMSVLPQMLDGLNEVLPRGCRGRVLLRGDSHFGTAANLQAMRQAGYHYLCPLFNCWSKKKLKDLVSSRCGRWLQMRDSTGQVRRVQCWRVRRWPLRAKGQRQAVHPRATVYCEVGSDGKPQWTVLLTDVKRLSAKQQWQDYHQRGGTIEEYNDQSERAYHLEVMRTGHFAGLQALQSLVALCWNLTRWATSDLSLPPLTAPAADRAAWLPASGMDLEQVMQRACHSGLQLYRATPRGPLEVSDTAATAESAAWLRLLRQPIQLRLRLTG